MSRDTVLTNQSTMSSGYNHSSILSAALNNTSSMLENSFEKLTNGSQNGSRSEEDRLTWLQKQQQKLLERREEQKKSHQESNYLIKELKTSLHRARSGGTETTDGYASDVNSLCQYSETSRESSPAKQSFSVPLQVETSHNDHRSMPTNILCYELVLWEILFYSGHCFLVPYELQLWPNSFTCSSFPSLIVQTILPKLYLHLKAIFLR